MLKLLCTANDHTRGLSGKKLMCRQGGLYLFDMLLQTEVLKQLSSMGRLVVCAGNGAVQSSTNLYEFAVVAELAATDPLNYLLQ